MELKDLRKPEEAAVLGRMTTKIIELPVVGESHFFMGWPIERAGRRIEMAGTLNNEKGEPLVLCRLTFVVLREGVSLFENRKSFRNDERRRKGLLRIVRLETLFAAAPFFQKPDVEYDPVLGGLM